MDFTSLEAFTQSALELMNNYGFILVIIFGVLHPIIEGPLHLFNFGLAITILGLPLAYIVILLSNLIGIVILFLLVTKIDKVSDYYLHKKKVSGAVLDWIEKTPLWKHIIVIGVPFIPTYPIKVGIPLSGVGFKETIITLGGSYLFLFVSNTLIYYGILNVFESGILRLISIVVLLLFIVVVYFGNDILKKINKRAI